MDDDPLGWYTLALGGLSGDGRRRHLVTVYASSSTRRGFFSSFFPSRVTVTSAGEENKGEDSLSGVATNDKRRPLRSKRTLEGVQHDP